jgi:secondary thiamine-phosphate synthase enzyme
MATHHETFTIQSDRRPTFHDVTAGVKEAVKKSGIRNGITLVYSQHTTCSVIIQEEAHDENYWGTKFILQDLVNVFEKIVPTCRTEGQYLHPGPKHIAHAEKNLKEEAFWSLNTDAHLRSVLLGRSESIPLVDGELQLGQFGVIYFVDFDQVRARERTVRVQIVGDK